MKVLEGITASSKIIVEYTAKLNDKAVHGSSGNPSNVELVYSNNPNNTGVGASTGKPQNLLLRSTLTKQSLKKLTKQRISKRC